LGSFFEKCSPNFVQLYQRGVLNHKPAILADLADDLSEVRLFLFTVPFA
jgi:hypothetical protein